MTSVTPGHNAPIHTHSDSDSGRVLDRPSSTAGEVAGHCGLLATSRMTPSARRVAGGRSLEASGLGRVSGIMPRVYVHVRPHERLDLTSHLTGSRRGQSRAAVASTFTIWVANAQAELVAGTTITTVDPEAAASVGSDLGVTQFLPRTTLNAGPPPGGGKPCSEPPRAETAKVFDRGYRS